MKRTSVVQVSFLAGKLGQGQFTCCEYMLQSNLRRALQDFQNYPTEVCLTSKSQAETLWKTCR